MLIHQSSRPPLATIIFDNIGSAVGINNIVLGIDSQFFTYNELLKGMKSIPNGLHLFHYSISSSKSEVGVFDIGGEFRNGIWINCHDNDVFIFRWESNKHVGELVKLDDISDEKTQTMYMDEVGKCYPSLLEYPENISKWKKATEYLDFDVIEEYVNCKSDGVSVLLSSSSPSYEENISVIETAAECRTEKKINSVDFDELRYTVIDLKSSSNAASVQQVTKNFLDKTWYLKELYKDNFDNVLAELQLSYLLFILLGNFSSCLQWLKLLQLLSMCSSFMHLKTGCLLKLLLVYKGQLQMLPPEYLYDEKYESNVIDLKSYTNIVQFFDEDIIDQKLFNHGDQTYLKISEIWSKIVALHKSKFNLDFQKISKETDESNTEIFNLADYDHDDEDAPTIV